MFPTTSSSFPGCGLPSAPLLSAAPRSSIRKLSMRRAAWVPRRRSAAPNSTGGLARKAAPSPARRRALVGGGPGTSARGAVLQESPLAPVSEDERVLGDMLAAAALRRRALVRACGHHLDRGYADHPRAEGLKQLAARKPALRSSPGTEIEGADAGCLFRGLTGLEERLAQEALLSRGQGAAVRQPSATGE